jgi:DNA-binding LacI/PurR family transcriptional regulator
MDLNPHEIRRIAVAAEVDPKTVVRWFQGLPVRALNRDRIVKALKKIGQQKGKT